MKISRNGNRSIPSSIKIGDTISPYSRNKDPKDIGPLSRVERVIFKLLNIAQALNSASSERGGGGGGVWYLIGPTFPKESSVFSSGHFQDHQFFNEEPIAFTAACHLLSKTAFSSHRIYIYKQDAPLTFTATRYLPPYTPHVGPLDPVTFKEATLFTCIRVH